MKLVIKRDQGSGVFGGISFVTSSRVELTRAELDTIQRYEAQRNILLTRDHSIFGKIEYTVENLIDGVKVRCKDVIEVFASEEVIKEACRNLEMTIKVMARFGSEDVIDFNEPSQLLVCRDELKLPLGGK